MARLGPVRATLRTGRGPELRRSARAAALVAVVAAAVLVWWMLPGGLTAQVPRAARVIGQPNFETSAPGATTAASVRAPGAVLVDWTDGRLFVADTGNNRVLSWPSMDDYEAGDPADLVLGQPDFVSDAPNNPAAPIDGLGPRSMSGPTGLALDDEGRLMVADTGNNRVLVFESPLESSMAADVALGQPDLTTNAAADPPSARSLRSPVGIAVDEQGSLVVADRDNNRVVGYQAPLFTDQDAYLVVGQSRFDTRAAGAATARSLSGPTGVAVAERTSGLYVADTGNNRVLYYRRDTLDGSATRAFGQPNLTSGTASAPGAATLAGPGGILVDASERLIVADAGNNRVLVYSDPLVAQSADVVLGQGGDFTSRAGDAGPPGAGTLKAPVAVAYDGGDDVLIADRGNSRVLWYADPLPLPRPAIRFVTPGTLAVGRTGPVAVELHGIGFNRGATAAVNGTTRAATALEDGGLRIELTTAELAAVGTLGVTVTNATGLSPAASVVVYAPTEGDTVADEVVGQPDFVADDGRYRTPSLRNFVEPWGIAVAPVGGRVFVADSNAGRVLSWPSLAAMTRGDDADLLIGQPSSTSLVDVEQTPSASLLAIPGAVAVDRAGNLYVADGFDNRVLVFRAPLMSGMDASVVIGQGDFTSFEEGTPPSAAGLNNPLGLAVDDDGNLWVADSLNNRVLGFDAPLTTGMAAARVIGQGGRFTTGGGGGGASGLIFPYGLTVDANGSLWVADMGNDRVMRFDSPRDADPAAGLVLGEGGSVSFSGPAGVTVVAGGDVWVADTDNNRALRFPAPVTAASSADVVLGGRATTTQSASSLRRPKAVVVDASGKVFVVDGANSRVLAYQRPAMQSLLRTLLPGVLKNTPWS